MASKLFLEQISQELTKYSCSLLKGSEFSEPAKKVNKQQKKPHRYIDNLSFFQEVWSQSAGRGAAAAAEDRAGAAVSVQDGRQPPAPGSRHRHLPKGNPGSGQSTNAGPLVNCEHRKIFDQKKKYLKYFWNFVSSSNNLVTQHLLVDGVRNFQLAAAADRDTGGAGGWAGRLVRGVASWARGLLSFLRRRSFSLGPNTLDTLYR